MSAERRSPVPPAASAFLGYNGSPSTPARLHTRQLLTLLRYHLRLLNWWLVALTLLGFLCCGALAWLELRAGGAAGRVSAENLSRFVMEPGAGLLAGMFASSLVVGDPLLEITLATPAGVARVVAWRGLLSFLLLLLASAAYLAWSLANGIRYAQRQTPLFLLLLWLAPVLVMSMLGLVGALSTRNATLGMVIAAIPLAGSLFAYPALALWRAAHPFLLTYTYSGGQDASDWLINRLTLLGLALVFSVWAWRLLHREESLLDSGR